jgi:hypothetical protein
MARVPGGVELPRRGSQFENRQKTCCSESPGRTSPCFACLIKTGLIKVAACGFIRIVARGLVQIAPGEFIQAVACAFVQVATCEFTRTARRELIESAPFQGKRTANRSGSPRRPVCPHQDNQDRGAGRSWERDHQTPGGGTAGRKTGSGTSAHGSVGGNFPAWTPVYGRRKSGSQRARRLHAKWFVERCL